MTLCSCMAWSSAAWVLGGVRLISSAKTTLAKMGPWTNRNARLPVAGSSSMISVPVMSLGHQIGSELDPIEAEAKRFRDGRDHQRLGQAGDPRSAGHARRRELPSGSHPPPPVVPRSVGRPECGDCPRRRRVARAAGCRNWEPGLRSSESRKSGEPATGTNDVRLGA